MTNSTFRFNSALECPGITLQLAFATIEHSDFYSMEGGTATFIGLYVNSNANISHSTFSDGRCVDGGSLYVSSYSSLSLSQCAFRNLTILQGGVLLVFGISKVVLNEVSMQHIRSESEGSLLTLLDANAEISQSTFQDFKGTGIYGINVLSLTILMSDFRDGEGKLGAAVCLSQCTSVLISSCQFSLMSAILGGVIYLDSASKPLEIITLKNLTCTNNTAQVGGVLHATNHNLDIQQSNFLSNSAKTGGALYLDCGGECSYQISQCRFENNSAALDGGAIAWKTEKPKILIPSFAKNRAQYGQNVSSFPIALQLNASNAVPVAPGRYGELNFVILLVDHYGQIVETDNSSVVTIKSDSLEYDLAGITEMKAAFGKVQFNNFSLNAKPNSIATLTVTRKSNDQVDSISPVSLTLRVRSCLKGEFQISKSCELCGPGTYSFDPAVSCQACFPHATCLGGAMVIPQKGYWRSDAYSSVVRPCLNPDACLGGEEANASQQLVGKCAAGYKGNLCQSCSDNFARSGKNECEQCPSRTDNYVRLSLIALAVVVALFVLVMSTMKFAVKSAEIDSILLRILLDHLQVLPLVVECKFGWPDLVRKLYEAENVVGGVGERAFSSLDCLVMEEHADLNLYFQKLVLVALLPVVIVLLSLGYWSVVMIRRFTVSFPKQECIATIVILFFMFLPLFMKQPLSMFSCTEIETGEYWLTVDLDVRCWDHAHRTLLLVVCVPIFIVWVLGAPLLCILILAKYSRRHDEIWIKMAYGFLINGYKKRYYLWEFLVYSRKLLVIQAVVFLTNNAAVQALMAQLVFILAFFLQLQTAPYMHKRLNFSEMLSLFVSNITIFCGLFFLTKEITEEAAWLFFVVIMAANLVFFGYMIYQLGFYYLNKLLEKYPFLRRIVWRAPVPDSYIEEFVAARNPAEGEVLSFNMKGFYRRLLSRSVYRFFQRHILNSTQSQIDVSGRSID